MIIKEAEEKDYESLFPIGKRIHGVNPEKELPFYSESMGFELFVLEDDEGKNIAFCCVRIDCDEEIEIDYIAIDEKMEGKGYASQFLNEICDEYFKDKVEKIFLEVRSKNTKAIAFYERNGFVNYNTRKKYYGDDDGLQYVKEKKQ